MRGLHGALRLEGARMTPRYIWRSGRWVARADNAPGRMLFGPNFSLTPFIAFDNRRSRAVSPDAPEVGWRARDQPQQLAFDVAIVVQIVAERLVTAQPSRRLPLMHAAAVDSMHAVPEPARFAITEPEPQGVLAESQYVINSDEASRREPRLELGPHERNVGQRAGPQERFLGTCIDDVNPRAVGAGLRPVNGELGDELVRATADRDGQTGRLMDGLAN